MFWLGDPKYFSIKIEHIPIKLLFIYFRNVEPYNPGLLQGSKYPGDGRYWVHGQSAHWKASVLHPWHWQHLHTHETQERKVCRSKNRRYAAVEGNIISSSVIYNIVLIVLLVAYVAIRLITPLIVILKNKNYISLLLPILS